MKLNKYDIRTYFNAEVCSFGYQPLSTVNEFFFSSTSILGNRLGIDLKPQERELEIEFWNIEDISRFTAELLKNEVCTLDIDDGYVYDIMYKGGNNPVTQIWNDYYSVSYPVYAIQRKALNRVSLKRLKNIVYVLGTWKCPCKYTIIVKNKIAEFIIDGITIKNLNVGDVLIIDGISKLVECNSINKFSDTNLKAFPCLQNGMQTISMNSLDVEVSLEYYPLYI